VEVSGLTVHAHPEAIAAALEMMLLLQERGIPVVASLPGPLVELAWSIGVGGAEVKLGRVGGASAPSPRPHLNADRRPRFEFTSLFTSFVPEDASALLATGVPPESQCSCPTCSLATDRAAQVGDADSHAIFAWRASAAGLAGLEVPERLERLDARLEEARRILVETRKILPKGRGDGKHLRTIRAVLHSLSENRVLEGFGALRG